MSNLVPPKPEDLAALKKIANDITGTLPFVDIVFDGPPGPESGRFVEVEAPDGRSISLGEWVERPDGYWVLRIHGN